VLAAAAADRLIASSPVVGVRLPVYEPRVTVPTVEQVDAVRAATPARWRVAVDLAAVAGLRSAEVRGLSVDRVDFLRRRLVVDRQLLSGPGGVLTFGPPKSARSVRSVPVSADLLDGLAAHVGALGLDRDGLVVVDELGRAVSNDRWGHCWRAVQRDAGVAVRFHDLRHFAASNLLAAGVNPAAVAAALGDTPAVLWRTYAHAIAGDDDALRAAMGRSPSKSRTERGPSRGRRAR